MVKLEVMSPPMKRLKPSYKKTETPETTDGKTGGDKPSNEKTTTREVTDGQTGGDKPPIKRLKQEKLLMAKLEVISTP